jgi:rhodanese-related sulfurtransferase
MKNFIKRLTPSKMPELMLRTEDFLQLIQNSEAVFVDIRAKFETDVWNMNFGLKIPLDELPDNIDRLPKDKLIVCGCPKSDRSIFAVAYLSSIGIKSAYLKEGMLGLTSHLIGGKAKEFQNPDD